MYPLIYISLALSMYSHLFHVSVISAILAAASRLDSRLVLSTCQFQPKDPKKASAFRAEIWIRVL